MTKYEYKTLIIQVKGALSRSISQESLDSSLNDLGKDGWELCQTQRADLNGWTDFILLIFKRKAEK